jgi:cyclic-di-AMP phosphodiesterase PgpH
MSKTRARPSRIELIRPSRTRAPHRWRPTEPWQRALELPALWVALFLGLGAWCLMPGALLFAPRATPGTIAEHDYVAAHDLLLRDDEATRAKQQQARDQVLPVYDFDPEVAAERDRLFGELFARGRSLSARPGSAPAGAERAQAARAQAARELAATALSPDGLKIDLAQAELLARKSFSPNVEDRVRGVLTQALRRGVVGNKPLLLENRLRGIALRNLATGVERVQLDLFNYLGHPEEAREFLDAEVRDWSGFTHAERRLLVDLLLANLPADLLLNRSETLVRRNLASAGVGQVFNQIRKGQVIVRKGDVITAGAARVLAQMRGERQFGQRLPVLSGTLLLLALAAAGLWLGVARERVANHTPRRLFAESLLLLLLALLGTRFTFLVAGALSNAFEAAPLDAVRSYAYAVPFASLALVATLLLGRGAALLLSVLLALLASRLAPEGDAAWVPLYAFFGSVAAIHALDRYQFRQRLVMTRVGLVVGAVNVAMALLLTAFSAGERGPLQVGFDLLCAAAGGLLAAAAASFAVPIFESLLSITTDIKLLELSNTNLPLLRRLAYEAPGTFQHSLMVANLTKEGCEAIGADSVLGYAAGLYHDVGKVFRPEYFVENQRPGHNPHDKLLPSMSALVLVNHVKEGLELAREHGLPRVLRDAIEQHHGTRLMRLFYNRAVEQRDPEAGEVTQEKYRYIGPRPRNKVMGVLMLADSVEAASRTLLEPMPAKIRGVIQAIVDDCLNDRQLDETDLTLADLSNASEAFLRVLGNILHKRVDYPGFDFNAGAKRDKRPLTRGVRAS